MLTWNLNGFVRDRDLLAGLTRERHPLAERMQAAVDVILVERPNVVLLQECSQAVDAEVAPRLLDAGYRSLITLTSAVTDTYRKRRDLYPTMYANLPGEATVQPFACGSPSGRYMITGRVEWRGSFVGVITAQFDCANAATQQRNLQAIEVLKMLLEHKRAVFGGDTNLRKTEMQLLRKAMKQVDGNYCTDVWYERYAADPSAAQSTQFTYDRKLNDLVSLSASGSWQPRYRRDHVWERGLHCHKFRLVGTKRLDDRLKFPSDHFGIVADFGLKVKQDGDGENLPPKTPPPKKAKQPIKPKMRPRKPKKPNNADLDGVDHKIIYI